MNRTRIPVRGEALPATAPHGSAGRFQRDLLQRFDLHLHRLKSRREHRNREFGNGLAVSHHCLDTVRQQLLLRG